MSPSHSSTHEDTDSYKPCSSSTSLSLQKSHGSSMTEPLIAQDTSDQKPMVSDANTIQPFDEIDALIAPLTPLYLPSTAPSDIEGEQQDADDQAEYLYDFLQLDDVKTSYCFQDSTSAYSIITLQGNRSQMQDTYWNNVKFVGVFDGHGNDRIACYLRDCLFMEIVKHPAFFTDVELAIKSTFSQLDALFTSQVEFIGSGCVCVCMILVNEQMYIVNLGDCRAVLCNQIGQCKQLSFDHTPNSCEQDVKRIQENNGVCLLRNGKHMRVAGELNVTRAFGDANYKQFITAEPDIHVYNVRDLVGEGNQPFLVLASDGLWDDFNAEDARDVCRDGYMGFPEKAVEQIYIEKECLRDNTTIVTVNLNEYLQ